MAFGVVQHSEHDAELDAVGMRFDFARLRRQLFDRPWIFLGFALRRVVDELHVRIGDRGLLQIFVDRRAAFLVATFDLERHLRAAMVSPVDLLLFEDPRLVFLGIDLHFEVMRRRARAGARDNLHRLAGGQLRVHAGGRYADALLAAAHAQPVKFRSIEQLREDPWDLLAHDAGAVVDHGEAEAVRLARRWRAAPIGRYLNLDDDFRQDSRLLAGIQRIVDGLFHAGEERLARIVEAQQMAVLGKKLRDRNLALTRAHLGRRYGRLWRVSLGVDRRRVGLWHG